MTKPVAKKNPKPKRKMSEATRIIRIAAAVQDKNLAGKGNTKWRASEPHQISSSRPSFG